MNEAFLEILFNQYRDKIIGFFVQFIGDQEQAKDLMQDVFLKLLNSKSDLEQVVDMDGYIYQMCRNRAYDHLKKAYRDKNYKEYLFNKLNFSSQQVSPEAEQQMDIEHYHEILEQSLRKLPNQQRLIFILSIKRRAIPPKNCRTTQSFAHYRSQSFTPSNETTESHNQPRY